MADVNIITRSIYALNTASYFLGEKGNIVGDVRNLLNPTKKLDFTEANPNVAVKSRFVDSYYTQSDVYSSHAKGRIFYKANNDKSIDFQFNPPDLSSTYTPNYEVRTKTGYDKLDYFWVSGSENIITFKLFLDATEGSRQSYMGLDGYDNITDRELFTHDPQRGVLNQVEFYLGLMRPYIPSYTTPIFVRGSVRKHKQFYPPPEIIFIWGNWYLEGVCVNAAPRYTLHNRNLIPIRAEMDISLRISDGVSVNLTKQ